MADQSFVVHLQSLFDFASELETQLTGMSAPVDKLTTLSGTPVLLGDFGEATVLGSAHQAAIAEMSELLGQVRQAVDFAENVTKTVATGYQQADQDTAGSMQASPVDSVSTTAAAGVQNGVWQAAYGTQHGNGGGHGHHHSGSGGS
ncbi:MAG TPA: hypothetical protein VHV49_08875 [Pseudonocardiaceae bacterium]|jgi:hypothetical protein|nr:hypothetical protein [Pseudonocardiaceae bacterium]